MNNDIDSIEINELNSCIKGCTLCSLSKTRKNAVPGEGQFKKKILIVGEAPGVSEDRIGRPFVGSAGKILRRTLENNNFSISDIYITNIVKCRPPNNRQPNINEKKMCSGYLEKQIQILKPKIICILGSVALDYLLNLKPITKYRGKIINKDKKNFFVMYHPAATLYNRNLLKIFEEDVKSLSKCVKIV
ncbi:MAG: uracil-DNA glycosylase [Nitrososphaeraceae archaeon]